MKKFRTFKVSPTLRHQLERQPLNMSAAVCQAVMNARDDDTLLLKALKRRLALPPVGENNEVRMAITHDTRIAEYLEELSLKTQFPAEQILRLAIEAYIHKL